MKDVEHDPNDETPYECFECGRTITARNNPTRCPDCDGELRNRLTAIE